MSAKTTNILDVLPLIKALKRGAKEHGGAVGDIGMWISDLEQLLEAALWTMEREVRTTFLLSALAQEVLAAPEYGKVASAVEREAAKRLGKNSPTKRGAKNRA